MAVQMRALLLADAALVPEGGLERLRRGDDRVSVVDVFERDETVLHVLLVFSLLLRTTTQRSCPGQLRFAAFRAASWCLREFISFFCCLTTQNEGPDRWGLFRTGFLPTWMRFCPQLAQCWCAKSTCPSGSSKRSSFPSSEDSPAMQNTQSCPRQNGQPSVNETVANDRKQSANS